METFNLVAGVASILGLGFTIYAVVEVVRLRRLLYLSRQMRITVARMEAASGLLLRELNAIGSTGQLSRATMAELRRQVEATARIRQNLPRRDRVGVERLRIALAVLLETDAVSAEQGWSVYDHLLPLVDRLNDLLLGYEMK